MQGRWEWGAGSTVSERRHGNDAGSIGRAVAALGLLLALVATLTFATNAHGDITENEGGSIETSPAEPYLYPAGSPTPETEDALTVPGAAESFALEGAMNAHQAALLTESVFGPVLEAAAGPSQHLEVDRYLPDNSALVSAESGEEALNFASDNHVSGPATPPKTLLLESSVPLETENNLGSEVPVNERLISSSGGQLEPIASPVEVEIPPRLGEEIELPASGIGLAVEGAPSEATPTVIGETAALYTNVAQSTDFTVAPDPTGIETFETLRNSEAPSEETLNLTLPSDTFLRSSGEGGAEVVRGGSTVFTIPPAMAIDAEGNSLPTEMSVNGSSLTITVEDGAVTAYPVLVDPALEWNEGMDWFSAKSSQQQNNWVWSEIAHFHEGVREQFFGEKSETGLAIRAGRLNPTSKTSFTAGEKAIYTWAVPRFASEAAEGKTPTTYVVGAHLFHISFESTGNNQPESPFPFAGIAASTGWAGPAGHQAYWTYPGNGPAVYAVFGDPEQQGGEVTFENGEPEKRDHTAKSFEVGVYAGMSNTIKGGRTIGVGGATVLIADEDNPTVANPSVATEWVNNTSGQRISATASDTGIGVRSIRFQVGSKTLEAAKEPCGPVETPCPSQWTGSVTYEPSLLPTGVDLIPVTAVDGMGHTSNAEATKAVVKVDHTAPTVSLSGTITQQATVGTHLGEYSLVYAASDGTEQAPQSGVAKTEVLLDHAAVPGANVNQGCTTSNCKISKEVLVKSSSLSVGTHTLEVIATDAVGNKTTKAITFSIARDTTPPTIKLSGALFEAPKGWVAQGSYVANVSAVDAQAGVRRITLKWEGSTYSTMYFNNCHESSTCESKLQASVNTQLSAGGSHIAEVIVTDWAGNTATRSLTINVDPSGSVPAVQIEHTIEAVEATAPETSALASTDELIPAKEQAEGNDPAFTEKGAGKFEASGVPVSTTVTTAPGGAIAIPTPEAAPVTIAPTATTGSGGVLAAERVAAVVPSTKPGVDTIVRPKYDGVLDFQDIRESSSPESYSWEVQLQAGEQIRLLEGYKGVGVFLGATQVMLIEAMPAHDALGHEVPTHLELAGNVVTLKVEHHKAVYTYPIVAGPSFEVGYSNVGVYFPPSHEKVEEERWEREHPSEPWSEGPGAPGGSGHESEESEIFHATEGQAAGIVVGSPESDEPNPEGGATASKLPSFSRNIRVFMCSLFYIPVLGVGGCEAWERDMKLHFHFNFSTVWWNPAQVHPNCYEGQSVSQITQALEYCNWTGPNYQPYGGGYHISAQVVVAVTATAPFIDFSHQDIDSGMAYLYGDGYASPIHMTNSFCDPLSSCE